MNPSIVVSLVLFSFIAVGCPAAIEEAKDCNARQISENRMVCVCSKTDCDSIKVDWPTESGKAMQYDTSMSGKRLRASPVQTMKVKRGLRDSQSTISLNLTDRYQTILGWGGAFTDATAMNIFNLSKAMSQQLIESYYGQDGLQYNFGRVPVAGSDFSARAYTYDDGAEDYDLKRWSLQPEDLTYKIPLIQAAKKLCEQRGQQLKLFSSPWSAPPWMKTSNNISKGHLKDDDRIYQTYANYTLKFHQAYKEHGIEFWGHSIQNEPSTASFINSMLFNATEQIKFVTKFLGPTLEAAGLGKDKLKLIAGDESVIGSVPLVPDILKDPEAAKHFSGVGFHWYDNNNPGSYDRIGNIYNIVKDKIEFMLSTEACAGNNHLSKPVVLGSWERADTYALDIIEDLRRHIGGWIDWNMALNRAGGPNWINNRMDSAIIVDETKDEFWKQPMYYSLAHFSRFFRPGSVVLGTKLDTRDDIRAVAAIDNSTGHLMWNLLNRSFKSQRISLLIDDGHKYHPKTVDLEPRSIKTVVMKL